MKTRSDLKISPILYNENGDVIGNVDFKSNGMESVNCYLGYSAYPSMNLSYFN